MSIRRLFGERFETLSTNGSRSVFAGIDLSGASREELLAVIGYLGEEKMFKKSALAEIRSLSRHHQTASV